MPTPLLSRLIPRSLVARVYALFTFTLSGFVLAGLALFSRYQLSDVLDDEQLRGDALANILAPVVTDSAVVGDYDSIRHMLTSAVQHSQLLTARFIDTQGHVIGAEERNSPAGDPPQVLSRMVQARLYDVNLPLSAGGHDYGLLRLSFDTQSIAGHLWVEIRAALLCALVAIASGLLVIRYLLGRWLGHVQNLHELERAMQSGNSSPALQAAERAPAEFRETFEVLGRTAASLQSQRNRASVTLGAIADGVWTLDAQGVVVLANPAACDMLGLGLAEVLGQPISRLLPHVLPAQQALKPWRGRRRTLRDSQGQQRVVDTTLSAIPSPEQQTEGYVLACRDMSEQHELDLRLSAELKSRAKALESLRRVLDGLTQDAQAPLVSQGGDDLEAISKGIAELVKRLQIHGGQLGAIVDLSPDGFVSFDGQHRANYLSPAFTRLTGLCAEQVLGQTETVIEGLLLQQCSPGQHWRGFEQLRRELRQAEDGEIPPRTTIELERPEQRILTLNLRQGSTELISQVLSLRDVTHETEVDRMKSEFLSTAAHELRTPMTSIYGFAELLKHRMMRPEMQADLIDTIHRQAELMIAIINELLDLARIEARRGKDFELEVLDLGALVKAQLRDFKPPEQRPAPSFEPGPDPVWVQVDRNKIAQALGNVVSNAYKYSPQGGAVALRLITGERDGQRLVGIETQDQGIGMTPAQLARIGERFYRADASGNIPGTGLGMSIVKEIVELQGGHMTLHSEHGSGTTVTLWLPVAAQPLPAA